MQAIILAGGKGTRLASRLHGRPKPLVDVGGVPLLERQLQALEDADIDEVIILVNHAADQIESFLANRKGTIRTILINDGDKARGTAGATLACIDQLADRFLVVYGDTLFNIDIPRMLAWHVEHRADATLFLHPNDHPYDSDLVDVDDTDRIRAFYSYPHPADLDLRNLVNAAFYVIERSALERWADTEIPCDFAKDLFPRMLDAGQRLYGYISYEYIKDLGTPGRLDKVEHHLASGIVARRSYRSKQSAIFLDRDGTLNELSGYVTSPAQLVMLPGAAEALHRFNDAEYRTILVTNQPVIARGDCTTKDLAAIHARLETLLGKGGAYLDDILFCPHHPDSGFAGEVPELKIACTCRKPETGMIDQAIARYNIDPAQSWMVGDSSADMRVGRRAGLSCVLVETGEGGRDGKYLFGPPDFTARDILEAANFIVSDFPRLMHELQSSVGSIDAGSIILIDGLPSHARQPYVCALRHLLHRNNRTIQTVHMNIWASLKYYVHAGEEKEITEQDLPDTIAQWMERGADHIQPFFRHDGKIVSGDEFNISPSDNLIIEGNDLSALKFPPSCTIHSFHLVDKKTEVDKGHRYDFVHTMASPG